MPSAPPEGTNDFWSSVRVAIESYERDTPISRRALAGKLSLSPATLSNFMNGANKELGGLAMVRLCMLIPIRFQDISLGPGGPATGTEPKQLFFSFVDEASDNGTAPPSTLRKPVGIEGVLLQIRIRTA
jgi:hypothetical protein